MHDDPESPAADPHRASPGSPAGPEEGKAPERDREEKEVLRAPPFFMKGEVRSSIPLYQTPEILRKRLQETNPELIAPQSKNFEVFNQQLVIKADSTMVFSAVLRIPGKQEEPIELRCNFDQSATPWSCDQMYPVDLKVAAEGRMQATAKCLDPYWCDYVGVELFVVVNGKTESQLFQKQKFSAHRATSGDEEEEDKDVKALDHPVGVGPLVKKPGRVYEKPTPGPRPGQPQEPLESLDSPQDAGGDTPRPSPPQDRQGKGGHAAPPNPVVRTNPEPESKPAGELNEGQLQDVMDDPNSALEITAPMPMPRPGRGQYSIPKIETLRMETGRPGKVQASGFHNGGSLQSGTPLDASGQGFMCRRRPNRNYGTDMTIQLLEGASGAVARAYPRSSPFIISDISQKGGGRLCNKGRCHASHRTGLDVDIAFPSKKNNENLWSLFEGRGISDSFDEKRFFLFVKTLVKPSGRPVIAFFIDSRIKRHLCKWARDNGESINDPNSPAFLALQAMKHEPGHHNHVHVRFRCPPGTQRECRDSTVSLGKGTGC